MNVSETYDRWAQHYAAMFPAMHSYRVGAIFHKLAPEAETVLECGCGVGMISVAVAQRGHRVTGIDISSASLRLARDEAERKGVNVDLAQVDILELDQAIIEKFDMVLCLSSTITHIFDENDQRRAVEKMVARATHGGTVAISINDYSGSKRAGVEETPWSNERVQSRRRRSWIDGRKYVCVYSVIAGDEMIDYDFICRAVMIEELKDWMMDAGLIDLCVIEPSESGYYQPIVIGRKL